METAAILSLVEQHLLVWNEKEEQKRNELIREAYAEDIEMVDQHFIATGAAEINGFINRLQREQPDYRFEAAQPIAAHNHIARLYWRFGPEGEPGSVTGMDLLVAEDGKVKKLYVFIDAG